MKRSVNFGGSNETAKRKASRPKNILSTMNFVGMSTEEQRRFLRCTCGPSDCCEKCSIGPAMETKP